MLCRGRPFFAPARSIPNPARATFAATALCHGRSAFPFFGVPGARLGRPASLSRRPVPVPAASVRRMNASTSAAPSSSGLPLLLCAMAGQPADGSGPAPGVSSSAPGSEYSEPTLVLAGGICIEPELPSVPPSPSSSLSATPESRGWYLVASPPLLARPRRGLGVFSVTLKMKLASRGAPPKNSNSSSSENAACALSPSERHVRGLGVSAPKRVPAYEWRFESDGRL